MNLADPFAELFRSLATPIKPHYTGLILHHIKRAVAAHEIGEEITLDNSQRNGMHGIYQCCVRLQGDDTVYRLLLMPANAPVEAYGRPIGDAFAEPLGNG